MTNSILAAVEPDVKSFSLTVPGGGLTDIMMRSDLRAVVDHVFHELLGPIIVGEPSEAGDDMLRLFFIRKGKKDIVEDMSMTESMMSNQLPVPIGEIKIARGGYLSFLNLENGEEETVVLEACPDTSDYPGQTGCFSTGIPADKGDDIEVTSYDAADHLLDGLVTHTIAKGLGEKRNSKDFRSFAQIGQIALEPGDPINYAPHWFADPLDPDKGRTSKNIFFASVPGDMFVPINAQISLARAAGLLGTDSPRCDGIPRDLGQCGTTWEEISRDCDCIMMNWKENDVMVGFHPRYNLDGLSQDPSECLNRTVPFTDNRGKGAGISLVRFPFSDIWVEYGYDQPVNRGMHWYLAFPDKTLPVNWGAYNQNQMAEFFDTDGYSKGPDPDIEWKIQNLDCDCPLSAGNCRFLEE